MLKSLLRDKAAADDTKGSNSNTDMSSSGEAAAELRRQLEEAQLHSAAASMHVSPPGATNGHGGAHAPRPSMPTGSLARPSAAPIPCRRLRHVPSHVIARALSDHVTSLRVPTYAISH